MLDINFLTQILPICRARRNLVSAATTAADRLHSTIDENQRGKTKSLPAFHVPSSKKSIKQNLILTITVAIAHNFWEVKGLEFECHLHASWL